MDAKKSLVLAFAFSVASSIALAGEKASSSAEDAAAADQSMTSFSEIDEDGNGMLDKNEAGNAEGLDFLYTDLNQDGSVSEAEYEVIMKQREDIADGATGDAGEIAAEGEAGAAEAESETESDAEAESAENAEEPAEAESSQNAEEPASDAESSQ